MSEEKAYKDAKTERISADLPGAIKVKVNGPGSITFGASRVAAPGDIALLTQAEFDSVKNEVTKL